MASRLQTVQPVGGPDGCGHLPSHHVCHTMVLCSDHSIAGGLLLQVSGLSQTWSVCVYVCVCVCVYLCVYVCSFLNVSFFPPDINWGSSTQAFLVTYAMRNLLKLEKLEVHVKNFR